MAYQVGSACYDTAQAAAQAVASGHVGTLVAHSGAAYSVSVAGISESSISYTLSPVAGGAAITHVAPFMAQPCNLLQASDGIALGWLVAAAWIGTYALLFLSRSLRGETGGNYGNA